VASVLQTPLEIVRAIGDSMRALAELPGALERSVRATTGLIADSRAQLAVLGDQVQRMMEQLEKMATVTDRLLDGAKAITTAAEQAQRQLVNASEQLAATNWNLEQLVRFAEPLDRVGKKLAGGLARVTGRGKATDEEGE
jgi:ABC-type transporter Mla subunit MlaD